MLDIQNVQHKMQYKQQTCINNETVMYEVTPYTVMDSSQHHLLSISAQVHCLASVLLATSISVIMLSTKLGFHMKVCSLSNIICN
jgi:hypothetical protein